ncbi:MAG: DcrB-related protein [Candidatus Kerfeldbacteria bacterium]|nr:DcrB-related protein [Candidatus Kerfeldbacteria bacterium]
MRYPNTWVLMSKQDLGNRNEQFVVGVNIAPEPSTAVGVIVKDTTNQESLDTTSIMDRIEKNFSETYTDFKKISSKKVNHDAYQELAVDYTYKRSEKVLVHQRQRIFITTAKIYIMSGSALAVNYPQRQRNIRHILESFQLAKE